MDFHPKPTECLLDACRFAVKRVWVVECLWTYRFGRQSIVGRGKYDLFELFINMIFYYK